MAYEGIEAKVIAVHGPTPAYNECDSRDIKLQLRYPNGEIRELWLSADGKIIPTDSWPASDRFNHYRDIVERQARERAAR